MVNERDARLLKNPTIAVAFANASAECFAQGSSALVQDAELIYRRWPFDVTKIDRPVHMWQGTYLSAYIHAQYLGSPRLAVRRKTCWRLWRMSCASMSGCEPSRSGWWAISG